MHEYCHVHPFSGAAPRKKPHRRRPGSRRGQAGRPTGRDPAQFLTQPLAIDIYSADPSAHVFNGKIYVYPSHDFDSGIPSDDLGNQYAMKDYQVLSMDSIGGPVTVNPSRSTSRTCRGPARRCGRRTPPRRTASTTCTSP
jgi:hypothetical protein